MATNYTQRKDALNNIANVITSEIKRMDNSIAAFTTSKTTLNSLQTTYSAIITEIDDAAAANPGDTALQAQKAEKDKLVADFTASKTRATSLETAVSGI